MLKRNLNISRASSARPLPVNCSENASARDQTLVSTNTLNRGTARPCSHSREPTRGCQTAQRGASEKFELLLTLIDVALARLARTGASGTPPVPQAAPGEAEVLTRLAPTPQAARAWAELAAVVTTRARHGQAVNLDPAALVLDTVFKMQATASR